MPIRTVEKRANKQTNQQYVRLKWGTRKAGAWKVVNTQKERKGIQI